MNKNYFSLLNMRILKKIITIFTDSFLVLYFMQLSNNSIVPISTYYMFSYTFILITILLLKNMLRWKKRICLLRIGILLNLGYFLMILFLNEKIINFTWLLGIIYGLEEGFYFSVFNIFESEIKPSEIAKYQGTYTWINAIISMVIPIVFGSAMSVGGVKKAL